MRRDDRLLCNESEMRSARIASAEQNAHPTTAQLRTRTSIKHASRGLVAVFGQAKLFYFDFGIFRYLDKCARNQHQIDCGAICCPHDIAATNFAAGRDRHELISFRLTENDVALHRKHCGHCRASDSPGASDSQEASRKRKQGAK